MCWTSFDNYVSKWVLGSGWFGRCLPGGAVYLSALEVVGGVLSCPLLEPSEAPLF